MVVGFGGFIKAPDAVSHSNLLDKVSSRHLDMYKTAGEGSGSNSKWGTSGWGPVKSQDCSPFQSPCSCVLSLTWTEELNTKQVNLPALLY